VQLRRDGEFVIARVTANSPLLPGITIAAETVAAAVHLGAGAGTACSQASTLARAMGTAVTQCVVADLDVVITVETRVALGRIGVGPARATARAGPVDSS
jgi:secretion/DNA translocation related TadE-like protein